MATQHSAQTTSTEIGTGAKLIAGLAALVSCYALLTPLLYVYGSAFHSGYLEHFHLQESMFPLDVATTCLQAMFGLVLVINKVFPAAAESFGRHWLLIIASALTAVSITSAVVTIDARGRSKSALYTSRGPVHTVVRKVSFLSQFLNNSFRHASLFYWIFAVGFTSFGGFVIAVLFLVGPARSVGRELAEKNDAEGFSNFSQVELTAPSGTKALFRVIECYGNFCAVYRDGRAYAVPASSITWAMPPVTHHLNQAVGQPEATLHSPPGKADP